MRKWLGLALVSFLVVLAATTIYSGNVQTATADDYSHRMMQSHTGDMPIASGAVVQAPTVPVTAEKVTYGTIDGKPLTGYLARPTDATAPLPGIIVIHEWWGLNENIETMAQRLAGEGYAALAVDLYEGQVAENPDQARALTQSVSQNPQRAIENLGQAYQYLDTEQQAPKIASLGWCFGGSWSLQTALLLPTELDAAVIYYGGQLVTDVDRLQSLEMPILGLFGSLDNNPSVETVQQFESALKTAGKSPEIYVYEGANHAFANPSGTRYNAEAAEDAWKRTTTFLAQHLKS